MVRKGELGILTVQSQGKSIMVKVKSEKTTRRKSFEESLLQSLNIGFSCLLIKCSVAVRTAL